MEANISLLQLSPKYLILNGCDTSNKIRYCFLIFLKSNELIFSLNAENREKKAGEPFQVFLDDFVSSLNYLEGFSNVYISNQDDCQILIKQNIMEENISIKIPTLKPSFGSIFKEIQENKNEVNQQWSWKKMASYALIGLLDEGNLKYIHSMVRNFGMMSHETKIVGGRL